MLSRIIPNTTLRNRHASIGGFTRRSSPRQPQQPSIGGFIRRSRPRQPEPEQEQEQQQPSIGGFTRRSQPRRTLTKQGVHSHGNRVLHRHQQLQHVQAKPNPLIEMFRPSNRTLMTQQQNPIDNKPFTVNSMFNHYENANYTQHPSDDFGRHLRRHRRSHVVITSPIYVIKSKKKSRRRSRRRSRK